MATVRNETQFRSAITNRDPEIIVANNITLTNSITVSYAVTVRGSEGISLFWASTVASRKMFIVSSAGNLTMESIILDAEGRNGGLVWVQGGRYTMNDGVILRNVTSTTAENAVRVGDMMQTYGGTFIMNGGIITGVNASSAVFCSGGTVVMNNDAAIENNLSSGINSVNSAGLRGTITMTGNSRISGNESSQGGSGGIIFRSDIFMGLNEGDAPSIRENRTDRYSSAGLHLEDCTLTMRYASEISDNHAAGYCGGVLVGVGSTLTMREQSAIKNNSCVSMGGGVLLAMDSSIIMEDESRISDNTCNGAGGGIHLQSDSVLRINGNASVNGNTAANGAGIYLFNSTAFIGEDGSSPEIYENEASNKGGGIFITNGSSMYLTGEAHFRDNTAVEGKGVYKEGILNLSQSLQILDGLFFDDLQTVGSAVLTPEPGAGEHADIKVQIQMDSSEYVLSELPALADMMDIGGVIVSHFRMSGATVQRAYTDNVPIIVDALTDRARIQLELSGYLSPANIPLVISDKGEAYAALIETDRAAWILPSEFGPEDIVILTDALDQVVIDRKIYSITYHDLFGAENPNPVSYKISDLPITLRNPGRRIGYAFIGWRDLNGQFVTEIPAGTTGNISLTAVWDGFLLSFNGNAPYVCNVPKALPAGPDGKVIIPSIVPCRSCHRFICWNIPASESGRTYFPGDTVSIADSHLTLYAQWQQNFCCCNDKEKRFDV